jgi:hypothetical protein
VQRCKNENGFFIHLKVSINGGYQLLSMKFNGEIETPRMVELKDYDDWNHRICSYNPRKYILLNFALTE